MGRQNCCHENLFSFEKLSAMFSAESKDSSQASVLIRLDFYQHLQEEDVKTVTSFLFTLWFKDAETIVAFGYTLQNHCMNMQHIVGILMQTHRK